MYEQKQAVNDRAAMDAIKGMSPVAWQHVHLIGKFEFITEQTKVDLDALAARFADLALWNKAVQDEGDDSVS